MFQIQISRIEKALSELKAKLAAAQAGVLAGADADWLDTIEDEVGVRMNEAVSCLEGVVEDVAPALEQIRGEAALAADCAPTSPPKKLTVLDKAPSYGVQCVQLIGNRNAPIARLWARKGTTTAVVLCVHDRQALADLYRAGTFVLPSTVESAYYPS